MKLDLQVPLPPVPPLLGPVSAFLSARWLPATVPWTPNPAWLDIHWPQVTIPPLSLSVLANLAFAHQAIHQTFGIDLLAAGAPAQLARIVATLNLRLEALARLEVDERPWASLLNLLNQVEQLELAVKAGLFVPLTPAQLQARLDVRIGASLPLWRPVLLKVQALAPLVAIGQMLKLDWSAPNVSDMLAARIRLLARIQLPRLLDAALVLRLVARFDALARLKLGLGADPTPHAFLRVHAALLRRANLVLALLPPAIRLQADILVGMPPLQPNLGFVLNAPTIRLAQLITPRILARLTWNVPAFDQLPLLTAGLPAMHLVAALAKLGMDPIRVTPCALTCDAATALRAAATAATAPPGT